LIATANITGAPAAPHLQSSEIKNNNKYKELLKQLKKKFKLGSHSAQIQQQFRLYHSRRMV
jgi:hypothetical protein